MNAMPEPSTVAANAADGWVVATGLNAVAITPSHGAGDTVLNEHGSNLSRAAKRLRLEWIVRPHASIFGNRFQVERAIALDKEDAWRGLIAARSVLVASSRLQQVGTRAKAKLRATLGRLDVDA